MENPTDQSEQPEEKDESSFQEEIISEGSISEHITSSASYQNDRSFQEIEIFNKPSALEEVHDNRFKEPHENSLNLCSFESNLLQSLPENRDARTFSNLSDAEGLKHAKSIMDEILSNNVFHSDIKDVESEEEGFNLFANIDISDESLINEKNTNYLPNLELNLEDMKDEKIAHKNENITNKKLKQLEEIMAVKDTHIHALSQELDSLRELSNPTCTSSMVSATEYLNLNLKLQDCQTKFNEYNNAIENKNNLIKQLSESLSESVNERKELYAQIENFKTQVAHLQSELQETSKMLDEHHCFKAGKNPSQIDETNGENGQVLLDELRIEIKELKDQMECERHEFENEKDLFQKQKLELESKHDKEVEELRTYFEKKCVELEKNYSEEVFSQQSRKMSGSSSDVELSADFLLSSQPGPGGDHNRVFKSKEDVERLKENLTNFLKKLSKHSMEDINNKMLTNIENEVKNELNTLLKIGEKLEIKAIENKYLEEISNLKFQLDEEFKRNGNISMSSAIQEVVSSGDYELNEVVESYERRLQEQITLAKIDIMSSLEAQIQRLASNEAENEDWPSELLQLRKRFTEKYELEMETLKQQYEMQIAKLKEEHLKSLNGALERARRRSLRDGDSKMEVDLLSERDDLKKQAFNLRYVLSQLFRYFHQAEDALNNTLVDNLLKYGNDSFTIEQLEIDLDGSSSGTATNSSKLLDLSSGNKTRVHLTPNVQNLIEMIDTQGQQNDQISLDISVDLKNELEMCLEKLRQEANAILSLSMAKGSSRNDAMESEEISLISKKLALEQKHKEKFQEELIEATEIIAVLQKEKGSLEDKVTDLLGKIHLLEVDLEQSKYKIFELMENRRTEVISEGYGEEGTPIVYDLDTTKMLVELQEKARTMLAQSRSSVNPNTLQLIEDLCRVSEKIKEDAKKDVRDLQKQIEVADKKYKTTQKFLEEQAAEREQERDEAHKKINTLYEQLKERDKDRANCEMMSNEADHLVQQITDLNDHLQVSEKKYKELESERDEAVGKIKLLRDIINDLEHIIEEKDQEISVHLRNLEKLQCIVNQQNHSLENFKLLTPFGNISDIRDLKQHCEELENEVQKLRISAELAGSEGALKQIKLQLSEIENSVDKRTRELELLHSTGTNSCSSPSEEMSVRDLVRPQTSSICMDECEVPLQQLARLKEKLLRHTRAEEAAIKRIQDLEMQTTSLRSEIEEVSNEKEFMKRQIHEQLVLISDLQIRLEQQRIKAEHIEKQTNTSLETKIYDLQSEIINLQEKLRSKEKAIHAQEQLIKETQDRVKDLESEIATAKVDDLVIEMQKELETLKLENQILKEKNSTETQILPNLVENIIHDKNNDIEKLRAKLIETEQGLSKYSALNLDKNDLKILSHLKSSGGSIEQLISILDLSEPIEHMRHYELTRSDNLSVPSHFSLKNDTECPGNSSEPEISSIEKIGSNFNYTFATPLEKPNSTELHQRSCDKRVRFEDTSNLFKQIESLKLEIEEKNLRIQEMQIKIGILNEFEDKITQLQIRLDETEEALTNATKTFEKEQKEANEREQKLGVELAEKKMHLSEREKEIDALKVDSQRKDEMYLELAEEKRNLEQELLKKDSFNLEQELNEKNRIIEELQAKQNELWQQIETASSEITNLKAQIDDLISKTNDIEGQKQSLELKFQSQTQNLSKVQKELNNKNDIISDLNNQIGQLSLNHLSIIKRKGKELKELKDNFKEKDVVIEKLQKEVKKNEDLVADQVCEIDILNEDLKYYQRQASELEEQLKDSNKKIGDDEKQQISELNKEIGKLQELIREKDSHINKMTEDQNQLHENMKVIDNKIKETGNIFDLSKRLKKEQKKNADLLMEIHKLKASLWNYEAAAAIPIEEVTGQVKKELECAAQIDSNILSAVSDQNLSSISEGQDNEYYIKSLARQKNYNKQLMRNYDKLEQQKLSLEQQCYNLQQNLTELQNILDKEKLVHKQTMLQDAKLMEQLTFKLNGALDYQEQLERILQEEKDCRRSLEIQFEELKKPSSSSESTKYQNAPSKEQHDLALLQKKLDTIKEEKEKLMKENKILQHTNNELQNNVKYTTEMLNLESERNRNYEEKLRVLTEKERSLSEQFLRKKFELEAKDRELEESKIKLDEMQQEKTLLKKQKSDLIKALKTQNQSISLDGAIVPETLENLIVELKQKSEENKRRLVYIEQIEKEKKDLEFQLRNEMRNGVNNQMPFTDLVARCNYLFAKSLKLESVKKALIWQKRYLIDYLESHKHHCLIEVLPNQPHENHCLRRRHPPIQHFRAAVYAVMSIQRMKFLVRRWNTGMRKYEKINARHYQKSAELYLLENQGGAAANFQVGQPVSNQHFSPSRERLNSENPFRQEFAAITEDPRPLSPVFNAISNLHENPWSGQTPPSKEHGKSFNVKPSGFHAASSTTSLDPLQTPEFLTHLRDRIDQIRHKLSLPLSTSET